MFTITADGHIHIDAIHLHPDTSAKVFQKDIAALPAASTLSPTVKWVERGSTKPNPSRSDRPSSMFKTVKKLEVTFPTIAFVMLDKARELSKGTLYFTADRPDTMRFELVKAYADYPQVDPTQVSILEHRLLNEWAKSIFGNPSEIKAIAAYGVDNLIFELTWGRVSTDFQTAGERQNEVGWSVIDIRFNNPSPDSSANALARWDQYVNKPPQTSDSPWWKRLFGG